MLWTDEQPRPAKNPLYALRDEILAAGGQVADLVSGNVNEQGIIYPQDVLKEILARAADAARVYRPDSLGQRCAREAIAEYYGPLQLSPDRILLTPGTSISYWYCFQLLAGAGEEILCPRPSYPLFDEIARLCGVRLTSYRLLESESWAIDLEHLESQITARTRAIVVISPHNPTGMVAGKAQVAGLAEVAARHRLPILADEVFNEFVFELPELPRPAALQVPLVFTLNGFSKMWALPGMKVGWAAITGEASRVREALGKLELMADTFLPVNEIAQFAVPDVFRFGKPFLEEYCGWVARCRAVAMEQLAGLRFVPPRGGFYITLALDRDEEQAALGLLRDERILVHPGYFYDIDGNHLVLTFIHDPARLAGLLSRLKAHLRSTSGGHSAAS